MSASPEDDQELGLKVTGAGPAGVFTGGTPPASLPHRPQRTPHSGLSGAVQATSTPHLRGLSAASAAPTSQWLATALPQGPHLSQIYFFHPEGLSRRIRFRHLKNQPQETACEEMERTLSGLRSSAITSPKLLLLLPAPRGMTLPLQPPLGLNQTTSARCYHPRLWFLYPSVKFLSEFIALRPGTGGTPSVSDELMNELKKVEPLMVINAAYIHHLRIHVHWASARLAPRQPRTRSGEEP